MTAHAEQRFRAMGCEVHLVAVAGTGPPGDRPANLTFALDDARQELERLEALWSRFRPTSELARLNRDGRASDLDPDTFALLAGALDAWRLTDARFDPTVLDALVAAGYDRSFEELATAGPHRHDPPPDLPPGPVGIELDADRRAVTLPAGVHLDLGGIGKGRAADLVSARLLGQGLAGACVNLGGDVRMRGAAPDGAWVVAVEDPFDAAADLTCVVLEDGAVATSSRTRRRWQHEGVEAHHLIDPATGRPAARGIAAVTVVAADAQWAEVLAKAAFVAGREEGLDLITGAGAAGLIVTDEHDVLRTEGFAAFERS
jgi:thiamine biosynthesis lipoprotein